MSNVRLRAEVLHATSGVICATIRSVKVQLVLPYGHRLMRSRLTQPYPLLASRIHRIPRHQQSSDYASSSTTAITNERLDIQSLVKSELGSFHSRQWRYNGRRNILFAILPRSTFLIFLSNTVCLYHADTPPEICPHFNLKGEENATRQHLSSVHLLHLFVTKFMSALCLYCYRKCGRGINRSIEAAPSKVTA